MADLTRGSLKFIVTAYIWALQFIIGYIAMNLLLASQQNSFYLASAETDLNSQHSHIGSPESSNESARQIEQLCSDCRLTSVAIEDLLRKPRQMDAYGGIDDRIDLDKIKKAVCKDIINDLDRERCRNFYFTQQAVVENWKKSKTRTSFFDFVCIRELKYCCPRKSFGPKCSKCIECGPNEHCHGEGTRAGNGTCVCKEGHTGHKCTSCMPGYYQNSIGSKELANSTSGSKTNTRVECKKCHMSCLYCRHASPLGCEVCQSGFTWIPAYGCSDVDECVKSNNKICGENTFCVNTEGSYFCYGKSNVNSS